MFLNKNLRLIAEFNRSLYSRVQKFLNSEERSQIFRLCQAHNGEPTLLFKDGVKEKYLLSSFNPSKEGEKWAKRQNKAQKYFIYGFGLGYHLLNLNTDDVEKIFIIEPSMEIFILALQAIDLEWLWTSDKYELCVAEKKERLFGRINSIIRLSIGKIIELGAYPSYLKIFAEEYYYLEKVFGKIINDSILERNTLNAVGELWTKNFFENLCISLKSPKIIDLFNKFKNIPIIIISAGPSLEKNVHLLHALKGRALLLCVATAFPTLKKHEIIPDFVISFDGGIENYQQFSKLEIKDVPLIFGPRIYSKIVREYKGKLITANICNHFLTWMEEQLDFITGTLLVGPSVANVTFDLARQLGGNPIIFVGQDLAFTDNKTHAAGTVYQEARREYAGSVFEIFVEDVYGNQVLSSSALVSFLRWFEQEIKRTEDKTIIDATQGGAKIKGTQIMDLSDVSKKYCTNEYPIKEIIIDFFDSYVEPEQQFFQEAELLLEKISQDITKYIDKSSQALNLLDQLSNLFKNSNKNNYKIKQIIKKLDIIDKYLLNYDDGKFFLQYIFQPLLIPIINGPESRGQPDETEKESQARILKHSTNLYLAIRDISQLVFEMIEKAKSDFAEA